MSYSECRCVAGGVSGPAGSVSRAGWSHGAATAAAAAGRAALGAAHYRRAGAPYSPPALTHARDKLSRFPRRKM